MLRRNRIAGGLLLAATWVLGQGAPQNRPVPSATPSSTPAAQNAAAPQDEIPVFVADTRLVVVHASVIDSKGKLVTNLQEPAFKVLENGVEQPLKIFRREDIPVSLGIIIDNSGSMRDKKSRVSAAALMHTWTSPSPATSRKWKRRLIVLRQKAARLCATPSACRWIT
jgi:hypothetical protein